MSGKPPLVAYVWGGESWSVVERRGFTTEAGACRFAESESARAGVKEVTVNAVAWKRGEQNPTIMSRVASFRKGKAH